MTANRSRVLRRRRRTTRRVEAMEAVLDVVAGTGVVLFVLALLVLHGRRRTT